MIKISIYKEVVTVKLSVNIVQFNCRHEREAENKAHELALVMNANRTGINSWEVQMYRCNQGGMNHG
jgi:hypothetical protein